MKKLWLFLYPYFLFIGCATSEDIARKEFSWGEAMVSLFFVMLMVGGLGLTVVLGSISEKKKKQVTKLPKNAGWQ